MLIVILFAIQIVYTYGSEYQVPKPHIKVLEPKGFRVSIPDEVGIQLFAFHGNINKQMDGIEAGQFSKDILRSKKGRWVFEDRQKKLKKGDVIYYWLFVIKDHLGYRRENGEFRVGDITSTSLEGSQEIDFLGSLPHSTPEFRPNHDSGYDIALKVSNIAGDLYDEVKKLKEINTILKKIIGRDDNMSKNLRFEGLTPSLEDPEHAAQVIVNEQLSLNVAVVNATRNNDSSITFQVASLDDKIYIIRTAMKVLTDSKIKLVY